MFPSDFPGLEDFLLSSVAQRPMYLYAEILQTYCPPFMEIRSKAFANLNF
jgi:hypothetical protein